MSTVTADGGAAGDCGQFQLELHCKQIQSNERSVRQKSLQTLLDHCTNSQQQAEAGEGSGADATKLFDLCYLPLIKCYADQFESCRNLAADIVSALLHLLPSTNSFYAETIVPVLVRRLGQTEIIEDSEEMRLCLIEQLFLIVTKYGNSGVDGGGTDLLLKSYNNIVDILVKTLRDPYPMVQRRCCTIVNALAIATPAFHTRAENLAAPLLVQLTHRQSPNRIAAVDALGTVAMHIANGDLIAKIIVSISPLLMDDMPNVRRECGRVGCRWLLQLRDRYSFFERILPLVLCCLDDNCPETCTEIGELWLKCGRQYYEENENELSKLEVIDHDAAAAATSNYPANVQRPSLGCRAIVQRSLRVCSIVLREMTDWKDDVRLHSLKLLWQIVLHAEQTLTAKFIEINPVLGRYCADDSEPAISAEAVRVAALMGKLLVYKTWIDHALDRLKATPTLGYLRAFTAMYKESNDAQKDVGQLADILVMPSICHSLHENYQRVLLELTEHLLGLHAAAIDAADKSAERNLYIVIVKVIACADQNVDDGIATFGARLLEKLCSGDDTPAVLHARYLGAIIDAIDGLDTANSESAEPIILLHGLITLCGFQAAYLPNLTAAILLVIEHGHPTGKIKIFSGISIAALSWSETIAAKATVSIELLRKFLDDCILPQLIWHAGRSAESLRAIGTTALCSWSMGAAAEAAKIFSDLAVHFTQLVEDNCVVTRACALRCLLVADSIAVEQLKPLSLGVLSRLDDPSSEVRDYAVQALSLLRPRFVHDYDRDTWETTVKHLLATMLLHLDSPEIKMQQRVIGEFLYAYFFEWVSSSIFFWPKFIYAQLAEDFLADDNLSLN